MNKNKILYVPPRGIGDLIFSLPLLHSLRNALPEAEIYVPVVDETSRKQMHDLVGFIKRTQRDLPMPGQDDLASQRLKAKQAGDVERKHLLEKQLFDNYLAGEQFDIALVPKPFRIDTIKCGNQITESELKAHGLQKSNMHMVDRFLSFAKYLDIPVSMSFDLAYDKSQKPALLSGSPIETYRPYVVFNLGASSPEKRWTAKGYSECARALHKKGLDVILVGIGEDYKTAHEIARRINVVNTLSPSGATIDLANFARLAENSWAVLSADTGFMHLADAVGAKVVGLFGPTSPVKYAPYQNRDNVVSRYNSDKKVENIPSGEVIKALGAVL
jgi:ADP-heptose:LPS heptosyltransferase